MGRDKRGGGDLATVVRPKLKIPFMGKETERDPRGTQIHRKWSGRAEREKRPGVTMPTWVKVTG